MTIKELLDQLPNTTDEAAAFLLANGYVGRARCCPLTHYLEANGQPGALVLFTRAFGPPSSGVFVTLPPHLLTLREQIDAGERPGLSDWSAR